MESDPKTGMQASRPPLLLRQAVTDVGSTKCGNRTPPCLGQGFLIRLYTARWVVQLDDFPQMCAFLCTRLRGFPFFCNNPSVSYADTSPSKEGEAFYKKYCVATPRSAMQPHTGEALALLRPPCAKGDVGGADRGIVLSNPSVMATPCHHPRVCCAAPHRGGLGFVQSPLWGGLHKEYFTQTSPAQRRCALLHS